ncbi:MarR family transcriptional regulator [Rhodococcus qingshengii]|uniref:MarR family transcriptional regulator n=1 Tax=Rhodococcus qingshengii TaxID=334542 RepID=UPI0027E16B91|nr:MarR family transcriptional regulator [Rhodococcus qingshengii]
MTTTDSAASKALLGSETTCLGGPLNSLGCAISRILDEVVSGYGLTADLWYTLDEIGRNDGIAMNELARRLSVPAPTLTKFVDRLASEALAFRLADREDRRRVLVHASRRGDELRSSLRPEV